MVLVVLALPKTEEKLIDMKRKRRDSTTAMAQRQLNNERFKYFNAPNDFFTRNFRMLCLEIFLHLIN